VEEGTRVVHAAIAFGAGAGPLPDDPISHAAESAASAPNLTLCAPVGPAALKRVRDAVHALSYARDHADMVAHYEREDAASGAHRWHTCKLATAVVLLVALNAALYLVRGDGGEKSSNGDAASPGVSAKASSAEQFGSSDDGERADFSAFALFLDFAVDGLRAAHAALPRFENGESLLVNATRWPVLVVAMAVFVVLAVLHRRRRSQSSVHSEPVAAKTE
jgi:hypothetical protein